MTVMHKLSTGISTDIDISNKNTRNMYVMSNNMPIGIYDNICQDMSQYMDNWRK
jgi:hypothetical protein